MAVSSLSAKAADTGPEYLESAEQQDPLSNGFVLFRLPFEQERTNTLHLRSFYQDRVRNGARDSEDWAGGGWLNAVGSYWDTRLKLSATAYTSQKIWADDDKIGSGALQPGHEGYSVLGEAYASLTLDNLAVQVGRYAVDLPYVNTHDIRMTPQTFQGAQAIYSAGNNWSIGAGTLTDIKARTSTGFDAMYERAGLDEEENVYIAGSLFQPSPGTLAGIYGLHAPDFLNGLYLEASRRIEFDQGRYLQLSAQYTRQESSGDELGGDFTVNHYGARLTWKHSWYSGALAWTDYPEEDRMRSPWGGIPGYTSVMIGDFNLPEETALLLGGTVDFSPLGLPGVEVNAKAIFGDTPDCNKSASPDRDEYNLNLNYRPPAKRLQGMLLQLRFGWVERSATCSEPDPIDISEIRFVVNFPITF